MLSAWTWNAPANGASGTNPTPETTAKGTAAARAIGPVSAEVSASSSQQEAGKLRTRIRSAAAQIPVLAAAERLAQRLAALGSGARARQAASRPAQKILTNLALGGRKSLTLVEIDGQRYLVGCGAESVTAIVPVPANRTASHVEPM